MLIIHILLAYSDECQTPLDVYFKFFEIYSEVNWDEDLVTIYGFIKIDDIVSGIVSLDQAIHSLLYKDNGEIKHENWAKMVEDLENHQKKYEQISEEYNFKPYKAPITPLTYPINIVDPLIHSNNLGKSISNFNSKRIKRIIHRQNSKYLHLKQLRTTSLIKYKQLLLTFFDDIYTIMGLKQASLPCPKLSLSSALYSSSYNQLNLPLYNYTNNLNI